MTRWVAMALAVTAALLYGAAWSQPFWGFYLYAPQYPQGLLLAVRLTGVTGDVTEINILNHYIGMAKLDAAAQLEIMLASYGVVAIAVLTLIVAFMKWRPWSFVLALPAVVFPAVFVAILYYWMWRFGHELSPEAPVRMKPFTPTLTGVGRIGNFRTLGLPGPGFYMILGSAALAAAVCGIKAWATRRERRAGGAG